MFNICSQCGLYRADKEIDPAGPDAICPACGARRRFKQLPLLLVCGPSGGGKSAALEALLGTFATAVLLEGDLLWRPEFDQPQENYRDFFETWLRLAKNINQSGRPVVLFNAGAIPPNIEPCVERRYFGAAHYLALLADDETVEARLRARPSWRAGGDDAFIAAQLQFSHWLQETGPTLEPSIALLDTTSATIAETAAAVAIWISRYAVD